MNKSKLSIPLCSPNNPCKNCKALCCKYFALEIDKPVSREDFEEIKAFVAHKNSEVFKSDEGWFLQINHVCNHLKGNVCQIYEKRPQICKDHNAPNCEKYGDEEDAIISFKTQKDVNEYIDKNWHTYIRPLYNEAKSYFIDLDTPTSKNDFENIKWYVSHKNIAVAKINHRWYVYIDDLPKKAEILFKKIEDVERYVKKRW